MTSKRQLPPVGVLFLFAAAVPVAIGSFEAYAHLHLNEPWPEVALSTYLFLLVGGLIYFRFRLSPSGWQNFFQDYRALAEAMRVQLFWSLSGLQAGIADNYLHKHRLELGWIQFAQRGPAIWAAAVARRVNSGGGACRDIVLNNWIEDQRRYFDGAAKRNEHSAKSHRWLLRGAVLIGAILGVTLMVVEQWKHTGLTWPEQNVLDAVKNWLIVLAATAPAVAAFFGISSEARALEGHAHSYDLRRTILARTKRSAASIPADDQRAFHSLILDVGREALNETAEWLMDHRHRPIEHKAS
jgi:hypothetical protein